MKSFKLLAVAGLLAAAFGQSAWAAATPHIYITGSTAFRAAALASVNSLCGVGTATDGTGDDTSITGTGNTSFIWEGGHIIVGGVSTAVTVCATFTGSQNGVVTVEGNLSIPFLPDGSTGTSNPSCFNDVAATQPHAGYPTHVPDFCFSDVYQATTPFTADNGYIDSTSTGDDNIVAICTFKMMASTNFPLGTGSSGATTSVSSYSIDDNTFGYLFSAGKAPLSIFSGNSADRHVEIFATGRSPDSGTRGGALTCTLYGALRTVKQYEPTVSSGVVTSQVLYPIATIAGLSTGAVGNSGEASGANLRAYMNVTLPATGLTGEIAGNTAAYYVTYLGTSDASKVEGTSHGGGVELLFKGTQFSLNAIYDGHYGYWTYEHVMDRGDLVSPQLDFETQLVSNIQGYATSSSQLSGTGISINDPLMQVFRSGDGTIMKPSFSF